MFRSAARATVLMLSCAFLACAGGAERGLEASRHATPVHGVCEPRRGPDATDVVVTEMRLAGVPAAIRVPPSVTLPPVVLWHGFGPPQSERALMTAMPLDDVQAVKVYLGLPLFGARAPEGGTAQLASRQADDFAKLVFEPIVVGAAMELSAVVADLQRMNCLRAGESIELFGFSAGGAAVLLALAEAHVPVSSAVVLNASTGLTSSIDALERAAGLHYPWSADARALARRTDGSQRASDIASRSLPPPAILIIQGTDDAMLDAHWATDLFASLHPFYQHARAEERLQLDLRSGMGHVWAANDGTASLQAEVGAWFRRFATHAKG